MAIFWVMSMAILSTYIQTTNIWQKMRLTRELSESAREITERIADDVRKNGLTGITLTTSEANYVYWNQLDYSGNGAEILGIGNGVKKYMYGKKGGSLWLSPCTLSDKFDPKIQCGLYVVDGADYPGAFNLVDSFIPEEEKKRVKIEDLKFYISGDGFQTEKKVTIVMTLWLMPRYGISPNLAATTKFHIQTTISESFFKQ